MKEKIYSISVLSKKHVKLNKNVEFYTTDTDAWLGFKLTDPGFNPEEVTITLFNNKDGSVVSESVEMIGNRVNYHMRPEIIEHAGSWRLQLIFEDDKEFYTSGIISFNVHGHIMDNEEPALKIINNWNTFMRQAKKFMEGIDDQLYDLPTYQKRIEDLEENDESITTQLAQTAQKAEVVSELNRKRDKIVKIEPEDLSERSIALATGDGTINLESIPQDLSTTYKKTDFLYLDTNENLFDGYYFYGGAIRASSPFYFEKQDNGVYWIKQIKPNTTYSIGLDRIVDRFVIGTHSTFLELDNSRQNLNGSISINLDTLVVPTTTFTSGPNDHFLYVSVSTQGAEPFLKLVEGTTGIIKKERYPIFFNNKVAWENELLETNNQFNLFDGSYVDGVRLNGTSDNKLVLRKWEDSQVAVVEVKPNTLYTIEREIPSRFNFGTSTKIPEYEEDLDGAVMELLSGSGETSEPKRIEITTGDNDKYLWINNATNEQKQNKFLRIVEGKILEDLPQNYNGKTKKMKKNIDATTRRDVLELIESNQDLLTSRKINVDYNGSDLLKIIIPSTDNYVQYDFIKINSTKANFNMWRMMNVYIVDSLGSVIHSLDEQTEWEGAIREVGQPDFMGGTHGDENLVSINFLFDGRERDMNSPFSMSCDNVKIASESLLNRVTDAETNLLRRYKVNEWTVDNYTVRNKYIALSDFTIDQSKITMLSCNYDLVNKGRSDHNWTTYDVSNEGVGDLSTKYSDIRMFEMWGKIYVKAESKADFDKYDNTNQYVENFPTTNRAKLYFDLTGQYNISIGEQLNVKSIYTVFA